MVKVTIEVNGVLTDTLEGKGLILVISQEEKCISSMVGDFTLSEVSNMMGHLSENVFERLIKPLVDDCECTCKEKEVH